MNLFKKNVSVLRLAVLAAAFICCATTTAQETENGNDEEPAKKDERVLRLDRVVVQGAQLEEEEEEGERRIESKALKMHNLVDMAEILSDEMVEASMIRKAGYGNEVSIRGFGQENMKVLIDGGILEGACGSRKDPSLSHINMLTVRNLTVSQGPFDVTKPGCLGGYIDVVTKKPEPAFRGEVAAKAGSNDFYSFGLDTTGGNDKVQFLFGYNYSESDQYKDGDGDKFWKVREGFGASYNAKGQDAKAFSKHDVWGKLQLTPNSRHTILLEHTYGEATDILTPRVAFDTEEEETNLSKASWEMRNLGDFSKKLTLSVYRNEVDHLPYQEFRNVGVPKNNIVESVITGGGIQNVTDADFADFTYGVDMYHRNWFGDVYNSATGTRLNDYLIPSVDTLNLGTFVQMDKTLEMWSLAMGLRYDRFRQEADEDLLHSRPVIDANRQVDHLLGGHLSARWFLSDWAMLFGGVGRSYRTPSSRERYIQGNPTFFGNPELDPTANTEIDLGYKYERDRWQFQIKGFYSDLDDYIYQENNTGGYRSYTNIDAHIYGGDVKASVDLKHGFSVDGGVAYQRGKKDSFLDNNRDEDLGQIAPLKTRLALNYDGEAPLDIEDSGLFGTVEWVHSEAAEDIDTATGEQRFDGWDIMNIRVGYQFKDGTLNIGVDNVFDRHYTVANSYEWDVIGGAGANPAVVNEPGRFFYTSLSYRF